ncbi:MAG: DUF29 family protein [Alphaproteobacteria bacterium]|nr:DUF29 family protein [Alphaproteobacteria bacterium]
MSKSYEADYYSWVIEQAELARTRSANRLDWERVAEELRALGVSEERELESCYVVLLTHLLKWMFQPDKRSRSWATTITVQRRALAKHLRRDPGLKAIEAAEFLDAYQTARLQASAETDLPLETFPEKPPFSIADAKNESLTPA